LGCSTPREKDPMSTSTRNDFFGPPALRLDLPRGSAQPSFWRWIVGTVIAVVASILACLALAALASTLFPAIAGYGHFQFGDYAKLTVIGVVAACVGWQAVAWVTSSGRRLYFWLAVIATVVSLAPDAWILHLGQPPLGVATLAVMHVALALVTYPAMVFIAPQRGARSQAYRNG
jgi:hypothetical protein